MKPLPMLVLLVVSGCAGVPREEVVWQVIHGVDVAQTVQIAKHGECYWEDDPLTRQIIGENPSTQEALMWGAGMSAFHLGVTWTLQEIEAPRWVQGLWQAVTIVNSAYIVKQNNDQGINVAGTSCNR